MFTRDDGNISTQQEERRRRRKVKEVLVMEVVEEGVKK